MFTDDFRDSTDFRGGLREGHESGKGVIGKGNTGSPLLLKEMVYKEEGRNRVDFHVHTPGTERGDEISRVSATKDETGDVGMCFHGSTERLLGDDGQRVGIVHYDPSIDARRVRRMTDKLGNGLPDTMNTAILLG